VTPTAPNLVTEPSAQVPFPRSVLTPGHAAPLSAVDRIVEVGEHYITTVKAVAINEPFFSGHYPTFPVYPGAYVIEAVDQAVRAYAAITHCDIRLIDVMSARFLAPFLPGDLLECACRCSTPHDGRWLSVEAKCRNDGVVAAEIRLGYRLEPIRSDAVAPPSGTTVETWAEARDDEGRRTGTGQGEPRRTVLTHADIQAILPHRHPMLLVDAITAIDPGLAIVGIKNVTGNEPCFARLDGAVVPASYAYPCSLIIESFGQVAGVLVNVSGPRSRASRETLMLFASISGCRFADLDVHPGETLEHRVHLTRDLSDVVILGGEVWMGRRRIAAIDRVVMAFRPPQALPPHAHRPDACGRTGSA
jgi:3-hydroxymyristoyl/3-hydroxydecanoyl-(acyl carrier protein) dehydratase